MNLKLNLKLFFVLYCLTLPAGAFAGDEDASESNVLQQPARVALSEEQRANLLNNIAEGQDAEAVLGSLRTMALRVSLALGYSVTHQTISNWLGNPKIEKYLTEKFLTLRAKALQKDPEPLEAFAEKLNELAQREDYLTTLKSVTTMSAALNSKDDRVRAHLKNPKLFELLSFDFRVKWRYAITYIEDSEIDAQEIARRLNKVDLENPEEQMSFRFLAKNLGDYGGYQSITIWIENPLVRFYLRPRILELKQRHFGAETSEELRQWADRLNAAINPGDLSLTSLSELSRKMDFTRSKINYVLTKMEVWDHLSQEAATFFLLLLPDMRTFFAAKIRLSLDNKDYTFRSLSFDTGLSEPVLKRWWESKLIVGLFGLRPCEVARLN